MTNRDKIKEDLLNEMKIIFCDHENRAYERFNPDYFIPGEMRDVGVVVDRALEEIESFIDSSLTQTYNEGRRDLIKEWEEEQKK